MTTSISMLKYVLLVCISTVAFFGMTTMTHAATTTLTASSDTYSTTFAPGAQKGNLDFIRVQDVNKSTHRYKHMHRGFVEIDTDSISATTTIESATMRLYVSQVSKAGPVLVQQVTGAWDESTLTMNNVPDVDFTVVETLDIDASDVGTYVEFDMTDLVSGWVSGSSSNNGLMLSPQGMAVEFGTKESGFAAELVVATQDEVVEQRPFIFRGPGEGSPTTTILTNPNYTYDYAVDWGDINETVTQETGDSAFYYGLIDTNYVQHTVSITGDFPAFLYLQDGVDSSGIDGIVQWGDIAWLSFEDAFSGNNVLSESITATDTPNLSLVTSMKNMFKDSGSLGDIQNLNHWDVSTVQDMSGMFDSAEDVTLDLSNWDTSSATDMSRMFFGAGSFPGDLINVGDISGWDTASVIDMTELFSEEDFLDISFGQWNLSSLTSGISLPSMSSENYSNTIEGWAAQSPNLNDNIVIEAGQNFYTQDPAVQAARDLLINTHNWVINDQGQDV